MFILVKFPFLDGDVSRSPSYGLYILEPFVLRENVLLVMFGNGNTFKCLSAKLLKKVIDIMNFVKHVFSSTIDTQS